MTDTMTAIDQINAMHSRLQRLELKNESDVLMIEMLEDQNKELTRELSTVKAQYELELDRVRRERDAANSKAGKVKSLLDDVGERLIAGWKVMKEDDRE